MYIFMNYIYIIVITFSKIFWTIKVNEILTIMEQIKQLSPLNYNDQNKTDNFLSYSF